MQHDGHILVIGAAGMDFKGISDTRLQMGTSNPGQVWQSFGGVARNMAENLARLDCEVVLLTALGRDAFGQAIVQSCQALGIHSEDVRYVDNHPTGASIALMAPDGHMVAGVGGYGIIEQLDSAYIKAQRGHFKGARMLLLDLNLIPETLATIFDMAEAYELPVVVNATSESKALRLAETPWLKQVHLLTGNIREMILLGANSATTDDMQSVIQGAYDLVSCGVKIAVITWQAQGLAYADAHVRGHIPAIDTDMVDANGAGDALTAGVVFGLLNDVPLDDAMRFGIRAATLTLHTAASVSPDLTPDQLYASW